MKKVISLLCMCFILTLVGGINIKVAAAETKDESTTMKALPEKGASNVIESFSAMDSAIVFDANGGKGTMENGTNSAEYMLPKCTFKRKGYKFVGWSTVNKTPDPENFYEVGTQGDYVSFSEGNATLYAVWVKSKTYKISYELEKGMKLSKSVKTYTAGKTTKLPGVIDNPEFNGWIITINGKEFSPVYAIPPYVTGKVKVKPMLVGFEG